MSYFETSKEVTTHCGPIPTRISNCVQYVCEQLVLYVNGRQIHLTVFQDVLSNVIKGDFAKFSEAEIAEMLLLLNNLTVAYNANSRVVKELKAAC